MRIRERVTIRAAREEVWPLIADPIRVSEWNPKLISVDREVSGPLRLGERFREMFRMSGRDRETECEVIELQHPSTLGIRHHPAEWPEWRYVDERYRLRTVARGTRLAQELDFSHSGIRWVFQAVMWFIHSTGQTVGKPYLESLREIAEQESNPPSVTPA